MDQYLKDSIFKVKNVDLVLINGVMGLRLKDFGMIIRFKDLDSTHGLMAENILLLRR